MAITRAQNPATGSSAGATVTATLGSAPTAGNTIFLFHLSTTAPTTPDGTTQVKQRNLVSSRNLTVYRRGVQSGDPAAWSVTATSSSTSELVAIEYVGIVTASDPLDQQADNNTTSTVTSLSTGTTPSTTQADELLLAAFGSHTGAHGGVVSWSNNFTAEAATARIGVASRVVSATGTYSSTATWTTGRPAGALIVTLKGATSGTSDLVVADAGHAHAADTVALTQAHSLVVADGAHGHAADQVALDQTGNSTLVIADAGHAHTADGVALTQVHVLVVADSGHSHTADAVALGVPSEPGVLTLSHTAATVELTHLAPAVTVTCTSASVQLGHSAATLVLT